MIQRNDSFKRLLSASFHVTSIGLVLRKLGSSTTSICKWLERGAVANCSTDTARFARERRRKVFNLSTHRRSYFADRFPPLTHTSWQRERHLINCPQRNRTVTWRAWKKAESIWTVCLAMYFSNYS